MLVFLLGCQLHTLSFHRKIAHLVELHKLLAIHFLCLVERDELNFLGLESLICEGTLDRCSTLALTLRPFVVPPTIKIVRSNRDQCTLASQVLVQLVLQRNEGVVSCLCEFDISQNDA